MSVKKTASAPPKKKAVKRSAAPPKLRVFRVGLREVTDAQMGLPAGKGGEGKWISLTSFARAAGCTKGLISKFVTAGKEGRTDELHIQPAHVRPGTHRKNGVELNILGALLDLQTNRNSVKWDAADGGNRTQEAMRNAAAAQQRKEDQEKFALGNKTADESENSASDAEVTRKLQQNLTEERIHQLRQTRATAAMKTMMLRDELADRKAVQETASAAGEKIRLRMTNMPARLSAFVMRQVGKCKTEDDWRRAFGKMIDADLNEMANVVENLELPKLTSGINSRLERIVNAN